MHNFGDNTKNHSQTLDFTTNFFLWILWISTCVWWITLWITRSVFTYKQSYPHYPQFDMGINTVDYIVDNRINVLFNYTKFKIVKKIPVLVLDI